MRIIDISSQIQFIRRILFEYVESNGYKEPHQSLVLVSQLIF